MQCVESLSVKCLSQQTTLDLNANKHLPEKLQGDIGKFRLAFQAVSEFAMKYCTHGRIEITINFEGMTPDQKYMIVFEFTFTKNPNFNEEPLLNLLNSFAKNKSSFEEVLLRNYEDLFDLI